MIAEGQNIESFAAKKKMVFYCKKGVRSLQAIEFLRGRVEGSMYSLAGGIDALAEKGS
jgi:rhodanese-related sulfurtransferase